MFVKPYADYDHIRFRFVGEYECDNCSGHGVTGNPDYSDVICWQCGGRGAVWELEPIEDIEPTSEPSQA